MADRVQVVIHPESAWVVLVAIGALTLIVLIHTCKSN